MPSPTKIGLFPYFPLEFTKDGAINKTDQLAALVDALTKPATNQAVTDLLVLSHGWNNDIPEAEGLYSTIGDHLAAVLRQRFPACTTVRGRRVVVCGILWPSKKFDDKSLIPGGAASLGDGGSEADATAAVDLLASFVDTPEAKKALARARSLVPSLASSLDARDEFVRIVRAFMPHGANDEEPVVSDDFYTLGGDELLRRLSRPGPGGARPSDQGGAAGLGDWIGKAVDGARSLANLVTFYQMKNRAGDIGRSGVHDALQRIREQRPAAGPLALRIHLAGHSFGARLVTAAAAGAPDAAPLPVDSLILMQAAFSHFAFATSYDGTHDGYYRRVVVDPARVCGVTAITFTANDKAVGLAYPLASRIARQIAAALGDANDPYGGLGRNGAQKTPAAQTVTLQAVGNAYSFSPRGIYNLDSNAVIGGHSDLGHEEVAYAIVSAMAAT
jgi:pimeloyl-ACP methyl ester carboxylesterase